MRADRAPRPAAPAPASAAPPRRRTLATLQTARNVGLAALEEGNLAEARDAVRGGPQARARRSRSAGPTARSPRCARRTSPRRRSCWPRRCGSRPATRACSRSRARGASSPATGRAPIEATRRPPPRSPRDLASRWNAARLAAEAGDGVAPRRDRATSRPRSRRRRPTCSCSCASPSSRRAEGDRRRRGRGSDRLAAPRRRRREARRRRSPRRRRRSRPATRDAASLKYRIVENILRATPRYQQARHDVEPGVVGPAARGLERRRSPPRCAPGPAIPIPVTFAPRPDAGLAALDGRRRRARRRARTAATSSFAGPAGLRVASASPAGYRARGRRSRAPPRADARGGRRRPTRARSTSSTPGALWVREGDGYRQRRDRRRASASSRSTSTRTATSISTSRRSPATACCATTSTGRGPTSPRRRASPPGTASRAAVAADFDRDGDSDLLLRAAGRRLRALDNLRGGRLARARGGPAEVGRDPRRRGGDLERRRPRSTSSGRRTAGAFVALNRGDGTFAAGRPRRRPAACRSSSTTTTTASSTSSSASRGGPRRSTATTAPAASPRRASARCPPARRGRGRRRRRRRRPRPRRS